MNYTTYYKLQKPLGTEKYDIEVHNANSDVIDAALDRLEYKNITQDRALNEEIQRASAKEEEILTSLLENKLAWDDKYTKEEIDERLKKIPVPTKTSDLENDCGFSTITGIKGEKEIEYHSTGNVNLTADNIGAIPVFTLENTGENMINLDTLTDLGLYKIKNAGFNQVVAAGELIACNNLDLFVGGNKDYRYQILLTTGFSEASDNFKFREFCKNNDDSSQEYNISPWKELSGNKTITKADIGLGNVDNTADEAKYVAGVLSGNVMPKSKYTFDFTNTLESGQGKGLLWLNGETIMLQNLSVDASSINAVNKTGDDMSGTLGSTKTTSTYLAGNQGQVIINSKAQAGAYTMLDKLNSTNGYFTDGVYQGKRLLQYTAKSTVDTGTNAVTKSVTLLDESGNTSFPGTVIAQAFNGNAASATKLATARTIRTNLSSTSTASFNGSANITPGVTGILPVANGGTGNSTGNVASATKATQDASGNVIADTYAKKTSLEDISKNAMYNHTYAEVIVNSSTTGIVKLEYNRTYLMVIKSFMPTNNDVNLRYNDTVRGGTVRLVMTHGSSVDKSATVLSLGTTTNTGFEITATSSGIYINRTGDYNVIAVFYDVATL